MRLSTALAALALLASGALGSPCGEPQERICFGADGGQEQNFLEEDLHYAANYLRTLIKDPNTDFDVAFWNSKYNTYLPMSLIGSWC